MPIAAAVPIMQEITAERTPTARVVVSADISAESPSISIYHLKENPPHVPLDFALLKEKTISTIMGIYKNINIAYKYMLSKIFLTFDFNL